jgi:2-dehydro-3-deoxyphosphogluconate aldolase/(4S)-4-hydroxy-2-oxoglutarate aldolase
VLPVASFDDPEQVEGVARALISAGLSCIEIAFRTPAAAEAVARASRVEGLLVGAGTILTPEQARAALEAGASFAVAPGTNELVMNTCREIELPFFPGVATPSEIDRARSLGVRTLKVFPISQLGGVGFLRAVSAVYRDVRYIPTGGIDAAALPQYLALDSVLACGGSWFVAPDLVRKGCFDEITRLAREAVEVARETAADIVLRAHGDE